MLLSHPSAVVRNEFQKEKMAAGIFVANQYLWNSALIQLDITTEVSDRFDCELFIRSRNFMISHSQFSQWLSIAFQILESLQ